MNKIRNKGTCGLGTILGIVFIVLKLTGHITWPWIWVTSPIWIEALLAIIVVTIVCIVAGKGRYWR